MFYHYLRRWSNIKTTLILWRWPNIKPTLGMCLLFAGILLHEAGGWRQTLIGGLHANGDRQSLGKKRFSLETMRQKLLPPIFTSWPADPQISTWSWSVFFSSLEFAKSLRELPAIRGIHTESCSTRPHFSTEHSLSPRNLCELRVIQKWGVNVFLKRSDLFKYLVIMSNEWMGIFMSQQPIMLYHPTLSSSV